MIRTECAGCGHARLNVFADLGRTPLADAFEDTAEKAQGLPRYPLRAATCGDCGLAQLLDVVDDELLYGEHYGFRTGGSPSSLTYMRDLAAWALTYVGDRRGPIIEIGCNDGTLMGELISQHKGRDVVLGIDPSGRCAPKHLQDAIMKWPFTVSNLSRLSSGLEGSASLVVAANVAAHVTDPHDFLEGISLLLAPANRGVAVIEFQYLPDLLAGCMFDLIYHEHRFFYSMASFSKLAADHGLYVDHVIRTPAQGGSLRVLLGKGMCYSPDADVMVREEQRLLPGMLAGFQERARYARERIIRTVLDYEGTVYGYAASAKSCTLLNWCGFEPKELPYIFDATVSKWGSFAPGTGIPIAAAPHRHPAAYLLLAGNYLGGILRREQLSGYKGKFIVPLPLPVIV